MPPSDERREIGNKDLSPTVGIAAVLKKSHYSSEKGGPRPPLSGHAVVRREENYFRGEQVSAVFLRLRTCLFHDFYSVFFFSSNQLCDETVSHSSSGFSTLTESMKWLQES